MFFWCCTPNDDESHVRLDIAVDENLAFKVFDQPREQVPTLLTSQHNGNGKREPAKVQQLKQQVEAEDDPVDFVTSAARGRKCTCLSEAGGERTEAEYLVEADSARLVVQRVSRAGRLETEVCPVLSIEDIFTIDDGEECFPPEVMESLTWEEKTRFFMIVYASSDDPAADPINLCLLEASRSARDDLLDHLRNLAASL